MAQIAGATGVSVQTIYDRVGGSRLTARLGEVGALRDGLDVTETRRRDRRHDPPSLARTFVHDYGWTWQQWHDWTLDVLATLLLR